MSKAYLNILTCQNGNGSSVIVRPINCLYVCPHISWGVCLLFGGFILYRKLELLAFKGIVPWISICVSTGVQSIHICCML